MSRLVTSNRSYQKNFGPFSLFEALPLIVTVVADMDAADTAFYELMQIGGTESTTIKSGSYFKGRRLGDNR